MSQRLTLTDIYPLRAFAEQDAEEYRKQGLEVSIVPAPVAHGWYLAVSCELKVQPRPH